MNRLLWPRVSDPPLHIRGAGAREGGIVRIHSCTQSLGDRRLADRRPLGNLGGLEVYCDQANR